MRIVYGDICDTSCDAIVNASNGIGFMGGKAGVKIRFSGVAESIHYVSGGQVEREAKQLCRRNGPLGFGPGSVFVTAAPGLNCRCIIHAVTMRFPGTLSRFSVVESLLPKILQTARELGLNSIAIPLLGAGTGHVSPERVMKLYQDAFADVEDLDICVYLYRKQS